MAKDLPSFADAVRGMHVPASANEHLRARHRFAILEAAGLFRRVEKIRRARLAHRGPELAVDSQLERRILEMLPFDLTGDQAAALQKIWRLMQGPAPMGVLLQGDVATGKTIVAWCVAMSAVAAGPNYRPAPGVGVQAAGLILRACSRSCVASRFSPRCSRTSASII